MKDFEELHLSPDLIGQDLIEFRRLLDDHDNLSEREHILPFFREHRNLAAFAGTYLPEIDSTDLLLAFEYQLFGGFAADIVIGDRSKSSFCFIEFEDAMPDSIFKNAGRSIPVWSQRFLGGLGQMIDWFWKLSEYEHTPDFVRKYGIGPVAFEGLLVIGRSAHLDERERQRLRWLTTNCLIDSKHIRCITLDNMYDVLKKRYDAFAAFNSITLDSER